MRQKIVNKSKCWAKHGRRPMLSISIMKNKQAKKHKPGKMYDSVQDLFSKEK